jgi:uncharacterized membrane-anchored protein
MRDRNVPTLDGRYWTAILVASVLGTTAGDFVSNDLGLGFAGALVPLGALFAGVMVAERRAVRTSEAYYWLAVVVARMAATNLGDFVARTLHLGYGWVSVSLGTLLGVFVLMTRAPARASATSTPGLATTRKRLPITNARYWVALLIASVMGTTAGDFLSHDTGLGLERAALLLGAVLAAVLIVETRATAANEARYWAVIALVRTAGTCMGDLVTTGGGLHLGFALGASLAATLLVVILLTPRRVARRLLTAAAAAGRSTPEDAPAVARAAPGRGSGITVPEEEWV